MNVTSWPISGGNVGILTVHPNVTWEFNAALLKNLTLWTSLTPVLNQTGVGEFCEPQIPAKKEWIGQDGVLQVVQHGPEGALYQVNISRPVIGQNNKGDLDIHRSISPNVWSIC